MSWSRVTLLTAVGAGILWAAGCGPKRPPAVATTAPGAGAASSQPTEPQQPVDAGPDIHPLSDESAAGRDLATSGVRAGEESPLADVHFDFDTATLSAQARETLAQHAQWLKAHPGARVTIEGHCDERGTVEYNLALGEQRARAVRDYLVELGVAGARLTTASYGKERPLDPGHDEAAWARNRRAHFAVAG
jgi:peptidoglycan-associated lipoprotein